MASIVGIQILVKDFDLKMMQFGEVAIILYADPEAPTLNYSVLVGGEVVVSKLKQAREHGLLPLLGTINHDERYYDIV